MIDKLVFLGSSSAFTMKNRQSNVMLVDSDRKQTLLIDAGTDIRHFLFKVGYSYSDINAIYISHAHTDHVGGLEYLRFCTFFDPRCSPPKMFISGGLKSRLWNNTLSGGMQALQGDIAKMSTYFDITSVPKNGKFIWNETNFQLIQTVHIVNRFSFEHSYDLLFTINGITVFYTSDTQFAPNQLKDFYGLADIIFHDCEITPFKSGVHAHYEELLTLPEKTRNKMWLYHYSDNEKPDAKAAGFRGFVEMGQYFDFNNIKSFEGE